MNAYLTLREHRHGTTGFVSHYELIVTVGHHSYNVVKLTMEEARNLLDAGVPVTED